MNDFIKKIEALNEELDKIPKDSCFQNHSEAGFGGKYKARKRHYHRRNGGDSSSFSSKSSSITNTYSYRSKHKPRHLHNHK